MMTWFHGQATMRISVFCVDSMQSVGWRLCSTDLSFHAINTLMFTVVTLKF